MLALALADGDLLTNKEGKKVQDEKVLLGGGAFMLPRLFDFLQDLVFSESSHGERMHELLLLLLFWK